MCHQSRGSRDSICCCGMLTNIIFVCFKVLRWTSPRVQLCESSRQVRVGVPLLLGGPPQWAFFTEAGQRTSAAEPLNTTTQLSISLLSSCTSFLASCWLSLSIQLYNSCLKIAVPSRVTPVVVWVVTCVYRPSVRDGIKGLGVVFFFPFFFWGRWPQPTRAVGFTDFATHCQEHCGVKLVPCMLWVFILWSSCLPRKC